MALDFWNNQAFQDALYKHAPLGQSLMELGGYKSPLAREQSGAQRRATDAAERMRREYLGPMLASGEAGIRGAYDESRRGTRENFGAQGRRVLQNASTRGLLHSGATRGASRELGREQRRAMTGIDTAETGALAQLLGRGAALDMGLTQGELEAQMIPLMNMLQEQAMGYQTQGAGMAAGGNILAAILSNPELMVKLGLL